MPRFEAFRGLRYQPELAPLAQVIAPPYDVISSAERVHLASRNQANSVLVELPEADLRGGRDRYAVATDSSTAGTPRACWRPTPSPASTPTA